MNVYIVQFLNDVNTDASKILTSTSELSVRLYSSTIPGCLCVMSYLTQNIHNLF